jgi:histidinol-phosphatase (PHP family)
MIPCDLHVHPDYSIDAKASIEQLCLKARQIELKVIGFSTHYDINPARDDIDPFMIVDGERVRIDDYALGRYFDDCYAAREQFPDLAIMIGLEVDYFPGVEAEVYRLKNEFDFDYFIGSVHCIDGIAITSEKEASGYFSVSSLDKMADSYFELLYNAANCGLFDVLGHADYYLRTGTFYYGQDLLEAHRSRMNRVIEASVRTNTGLEINTSHHRHGRDSFYPQPDFLVRAIKLGATLNSLGSDAHRLNQLGSGIVDALDIISELAIEFKPFYEK